MADMLEQRLRRRATSAGVDESYLDELVNAFKNSPSSGEFLDEHLQSVQGETFEKIAEYLARKGNSSVPLVKRQVVLLIHGIRTHATWQEMVADNLEEPDITVIPLRYGYLDVLRFWFPLFTRERAIRRVLRDIRYARDRYPDSYLSIIAHSFGTYAIGKILQDNPDIHIYRLILCGSILNADFRWDQLRNQIEGGVINECGYTRYLAYISAIKYMGIW